jgi:hypothetical protein
MLVVVLLKRKIGIVEVKYIFNVLYWICFCICGNYLMGFFLLWNFFFFFLSTLLRPDNSLVSSVTVSVSMPEWSDLEKNWIEVDDIKDEKESELGLITTVNFEDFLTNI